MGIVWRGSLISNFWACTWMMTLPGKQTATMLIKKAQQRLYFLRVLKNNALNKELLVSFYRSSIESVLTYCIPVWFASCTAQEKTALQRVVNTEQKIIGCELLSLEELYRTRCLKKACSILKDSSHPAHHLFKLLPSGRRYRTIKAKTNRLKNTTFHRAVAILNEH